MLGMDLPQMPWLHKCHPRSDNGLPRAPGGHSQCSCGWNHLAAHVTWCHASVASFVAGTVLCPKLLSTALSAPPGHCSDPINPEASCWKRRSLLELETPALTKATIARSALVLAGLPGAPRTCKQSVAEDILRSSLSQSPGAAHKPSDLITSKSDQGKRPKLPTLLHPRRVRLLLPCSAAPQC